MIFTDVKTKGIRKEFGELERIMTKKLGFVRWSWDFGKVTYDLKYTLDGVDYYLRLSGRVVNEKRLENKKALVELDHPRFARHFFPHGLDETVEVPEGLSEDVKAKLTELENALNE
ncbi:YugN family protein [Staphylospora marina]|uniref:YugN family protein n=1 Tax=Staphylospora marina TaxID=2490858 RepID=UPI000F5C175C|nr:YugN family protein [Staphylospora marina]